MGTSSVVWKVNSTEITTRCMRIGWGKAGKGKWRPHNVGKHELKLIRVDFTAPKWIKMLSSHPAVHYQSFDPNAFQKCKIIRYLSNSKSLALRHSLHSLFFLLSMRLISIPARRYIHSSLLSYSGQWTASKCGKLGLLQLKTSLCLNWIIKPTISDKVC